jgi:small-conductance mechanosensitive channel
MNQLFNREQFLELWLSPILIVTCAIIFGYLFKRFFHSKLKKITKMSKWEGDDILLNSLESQVVLWSFLFSLFLVFRDIPIKDEYSTFILIVIKILLIASVTHALAKLILGLFELWSKKQEGGFPSTTIFTNIVKITIYVIGLLIILDSVNISIAPMLTALGVGGLAVSLALKDTLSDVFAGLHILLSKKVQPGDFVSLDSGEMGYIQNITWRNTKMLERTNNILHIPNTKLSSAIVKNYDSGDPSFSVKVFMGVDYNSDLEQVERVALEEANKLHSDMEETNKLSQPSFKFRGFGESSIDFAIYFRGNKYGDQNPIIHQFIKNIHKRFKKEKIQIPFPIRTIIKK